VSANAKHSFKDSLALFYKDKNNIITPIPETYTLSVTQNKHTFKIGFLSLVIDANKKDYVNYEDRYTSAKRIYSGLKAKIGYCFRFYTF